MRKILTLKNVHNGIYKQFDIIVFVCKRKRNVNETLWDICHAKG